MKNTIKIASWNVNSIRSRLSHIEELHKTSKIDVLCVQETKAQDKDFPVGAIKEIGYDSVFFGQKQYNGVAILSKLPIDKAEYGFSDPTLNTEKRLISCKINDIIVINTYVPRGGEQESEKFYYKLSFIDELIKLIANKLKECPNILIMGDFNVALTQLDIAEKLANKDQIGFFPEERKKLQELIDWGMTDLYRKNNPEKQEFSWWDYRHFSFNKNVGMRLDYIFASKSLQNDIKTCYIDKTPRTWEKPSDHTPVVCEVAIN